MIGGPLDTQEVSVAVQSIRTSIEVRDVAGDHLFVPPSKVPFGEMDGIRELDHLTQKVRSRTEAFDDAGDLLPPRARTPKIIGGRRVTDGFCVFSDSDFRGDLRIRKLCRKLRLRDPGLIVLVIFCRHVEASILSET